MRDEDERGPLFDHRQKQHQIDISGAAPLGLLMCVGGDGGGRKATAATEGGGGSGNRLQSFSRFSVTARGGNHLDSRRDSGRRCSKGTGSVKLIHIWHPLLSTVITNAWKKHAKSKMIMKNIGFDF